MAHIDIKNITTSTIKGISTSIIDKINEEVMPTINTHETTINEEIKPTIEKNKSNIKIINNILNEELCPMSTELNEVYIPIITKILLSNLFMFLNRIFKWYAFSIHETSENSMGITQLYSNFIFYQ